ncbi:MAG: hypothetical protein NVS9B7_25160 [Flavisolibacter sp.]
MQCVLVYVLAFAYCSTLIKPILPTIADKFQHTFCYTEHIASVHHHNGNDHVLEEYIHTSKTSLPGNNSILVDEIFSSVHLISKNLYLVILLTEALRHFSNAVFPLFYVSLKVASPPPKA